MKAVSIDDERVNLIILEEMGKEIGLETVSFQNPLEGLDFIRSNDVDIVFIDYMMPGMNGVELLREIKKIHADIPLVMITSISGDDKLKLDALNAGATDFLNKPLDGAEFKARINNLTALRKSQLLLKDRALLLEEEVRKATEVIEMREFETLQVLGNAAEFRDSETSDHIKRVAHYCRMIAEHFYEERASRDQMFYASPLHDVGKLGVMDSILFKKGNLDYDEFEEMKKHTEYGHGILINAEGPHLKAGAIIALTHHEKYDGTGYPNGLKGDKIHLYGRITAVADVFDALTSKRPYKEAWPFEKAVKEIEDERGKHFDPEVAGFFLDNLGRVREIYNRFRSYGK